MLINCTNHPYEIWTEKLKEAAECYGTVMDLPFPQIDPLITTEKLRELTRETADRIMEMHPEAVLLAGEYTFTFMLADKLLKDGVRVLCIRNRRQVTESRRPDGTNEKKSIFIFEAFGEYAYYKEQ